MNFAYINKYYDAIYAWLDLEVACEELYMYSYHLWEDNNFQLRFDDSLSPYEENINKEPLMTTSF